jgi:pSer/pThr/pTyr-binding forkhead associated (FHA) protein
LYGTEPREIGIVCGDCEVMHAPGTQVCTACGADLRLRTRVTLHIGDSEPPDDSRPTQVHPERMPAPPTPARVTAAGGTVRATPEVAARAATLSPDEEKPMEPAHHYVCRSCSSSVPSGHKFCGRCGTSVPADIRDLRTNYFGDMQNPQKAKLILIRGEGMDGLSFHLKAEQHIVGREGQLIFPDDPFVSPRHANFFYREGALVVRDEGSLNGVYVRIRGTVPIAAGHTFLAGEQVFRVEGGETVTDDGPEPDGTNFYSSPKKEAHFRLSQVLRGGLTGMTVCATGTSLVVGRDGADLNFPEDLYMSAQHCRVEMQGGKLTLTDLNSRNGTYARITDERVLQHGDYVFIGRKLLRVEMNSN